MNDFSSFKNRYYINADIVMERPLHIGKGASLEPIGTDLPVIKTPDERPYIPGSSIKGVLRTLFEKYSRTMESQNIEIGGKSARACDILDEKNRCITTDKRKAFENVAMEECEKDDKKTYEEEFTKNVLANSCQACVLFGSPEMASKVYIKDAFLIDKDYPIKTEIRDGVAIDRDTGTTKPGMKFDYEIVPAGASFKLEAILENVEDWEVGLFGLLLKSWERGEIAIGGKSSIGLGWGKLENIKIERIESADLLDFLIDGKKKPIELNTFIEPLKTKLKKVGDENA